MRKPQRAECVVAGAGIAGVAAAWHLACASGVRDILLLDPRAPLSLTSDKSTECFRNWWPHPGLVALVERSLAWMRKLEPEQPGRLVLQPHGYLYLTGSLAGREALLAQAEAASQAGAGPLSEVPPGCGPWRPPAESSFGLEGAGAELYLDSRSLKAAFPWVSPDAVAGVYVRCAGWLAAQQLGMMLFEQAQAAGAEFLSGELLEPELQGGKLGGIWVRFSNRIERIETPSLIVATGPLLPDLLERWGFPLPLETEAHFKVIFDDFEKRLPRPSPLVIWSDPIQLAWSAELLREIAADVTLRFLLDPLPGGIHFRPEGGVDSTRSLLLWNFQATPGPFVTDPQPPDHHVPVVLHGIARIVPGFEVYLESARKPFVDGGFYTLAPDELPVLGSLRPGLGIHVLGAFGGYGIMTAFAAAELVVQELLGLPLPSWSAAFHPSRFADPAYRSETQGPSAKL